MVHRGPYWLVSFLVYLIDPIVTIVILVCFTFMEFIVRHFSKKKIGDIVLVLSVCLRSWFTHDLKDFNETWYEFLNFLHFMVLMFFSSPDSRSYSDDFLSVPHSSVNYIPRYKVYGGYIGVRLVGRSVWSVDISCEQYFLQTFIWNFMKLHKNAWYQA